MKWEKGKWENWLRGEVQGFAEDWQ